jgi:hypothetical protein
VQRIRGSTLAFNTLLQEMVKMDKIALARLISRKTYGPRFVAMIPQAEKADATGMIVQPPGFHLIFMPFADDLRELKLPPTAIGTPTGSYSGPLLSLLTSSRLAPSCVVQPIAI